MAIKNIEKEAVKSESKFSVSSLRENCFKLFGVEKHVFDGVMASKEPTEEYSVEEIKQLIEKWGERKAK